MLQTGEIKSTKCKNLCVCVCVCVWGVDKERNTLQILEIVFVLAFERYFCEIEQLQNPFNGLFNHP